jgi:hypothetical protein
MLRVWENKKCIRNTSGKPHGEILMESITMLFSSLL